MAADDRFGQGRWTRRDDGSAGTRSEIVTGPVADWAADFSHLDPAWAADPYPIQDDLRQRCPIAHTGRFGGAWLPTRYEDVAAIAYDTERFSSRAIIVSNVRPPADLAPAAGSPPIPGCRRPRSRSSCVPTRRSPWPGWSGRTCAGAGRI